MISANIDRVRERIASACRRAGRRHGGCDACCGGKDLPGRDGPGSGPCRCAGHRRELCPGSSSANGSGLGAGRPLALHRAPAVEQGEIRCGLGASDPCARQSFACEGARPPGRTAGRIIEALVEVNTTGEAVEIRPAAGRVLRSSSGRSKPFSHIRIAGLMTIGPFLPDPEGSRPMFRTLRTLRDETCATAAGERAICGISRWG